MNFFAFSSLLAATVTFALGVFVLSNDSGKAINRIFFLYCLTGSFWTFSEFGYRQAESYKVALFWFRASAISLPVLPLQLHFVLYFTERRKLYKNIFVYAILYIPPLIFGLVDLLNENLFDLERVPWGWTYVPIPSQATYLFDYWFSIGLLLAFALSFYHFIQTKDFPAKNSAAFVMLAIGAIVVLAYLSEPGGILPNLGIVVPELTSYGFLIACLLLTYAIWKWELFDISSLTAAENIIETMSDALFLLDGNGSIVQVNQAALDLLGFREQELHNRPIEKFIAPGSINQYHVVFSELLSSSSAFIDKEIDFLGKNESIIPISLSASVVLDKSGSRKGIVFAGRDLIERKYVEAQIRKSLREKETLLKEIHHRVKNNLQVITSLLKLQSKHTLDEHSQNALRESQSRIQSMAIVHEMLYQTENLNQIDFSSYTKTLVDHIRRLQAIDSGAIEIKYRISSLALSIDEAINCGLIINELVTNSLKHAFPGGRSGEILISFGEIDTNQIELRVHDNGVGLLMHIGLDWAESLGFQLVNILANQLGGKVELDRVSGTEVIIVFPRG